MKKKLCFILITGALLAGCSNNVPNYEDKQSLKNEAISFKTLRNKVGTKAANDNSEIGRAHV